MLLGNGSSSCVVVGLFDAAVSVIYLHACTCNAYDCPLLFINNKHKACSQWQTIPVLTHQSWHSNLF
jgi:hypothetical protein